MCLTKYVDDKFHFIKVVSENGFVELKKVDKNNNLIDMVAHTSQVFACNSLVNVIGDIRTN